MYPSSSSLKVFLYPLQNYNHMIPFYTTETQEFLANILPSFFQIWHQFLFYFIFELPFCVQGFIMLLDPCMSYFILSFTSGLCHFFYFVLLFDFFSRNNESFLLCFVLFSCNLHLNLSFLHRTSKEKSISYVLYNAEFYGKVRPKAVRDYICLLR